MGFNQAPQKKQMSQPYSKPQAPPNPYLRSNQQASTEPGPIQSPDGQSALQMPEPKKGGQSQPGSIPVVQRNVSNAALQGGAPSGGQEAPVGGVSGFTPDMGDRRAAAMTPPSRNPNAADYNRTLTEPEYQGVMDRERAWSPNAGSTYSGPTLGQAMDQYGGGSANFTLPNGGGEQVSPLDYLKRSPYSHQGRFARLPGTEMEKWKNGTYKG